MSHAYRQALDALKRARSAKSQATTLLLDDETHHDILQQVDDNQYNQILQKNSTKGFIVDDDGGEYNDEDDMENDIYLEEEHADVQNKAVVKKRQRENVDLFKSTMPTSKKKVVVQKGVFGPRAANVQVDEDQLAKAIEDEQANLKSKEDYQRPKFTLKRIDWKARLKAIQQSNEGPPPDKIRRFDEPCLTLAPPQEAQTKMQSSAPIFETIDEPSAADVTSAPPLPAEEASAQTGHSTAVDSHSSTSDFDPSTSVPHHHAAARTSAPDVPPDLPLADLEEIFNELIAKARPMRQSDAISQNALDGDLTCLYRSINGRQGLPFYFIDAMEETLGDHYGQVCLFGKVVTSDTNTKAASCAVRLRNVPRNVFLRLTNQPQNIDDQAECKHIVTQAAADIKKIFENIAADEINVVWRKRKVVFESQSLEGKCNIPPNKPELYLKLTFASNVRLPHVSVFTKGESFTHAFGASRSLLEAFCIKRRIKGPSWMLLTHVNLVQCEKLSYCAYEVCVEDIKTIHPIEWCEESALPQTSPLTLMSLSVKSYKSKAIGVEVAVGNLAGLKDFNISEALDQSEVVDSSCLYVHPRTVRSSTEKRFVGEFNSFKDFLVFLVKEIAGLDPDIILSHDAYGSLLPTLVSWFHSSALKEWARLSRWKRRSVPLTATHLRISPYEQKTLFFTGRLVCDTYKLAQETLGARTDYTLRSVLSEVWRDCSCPEHRFIENFLVEDRQLYDAISAPAVTEKHELAAKKYPSLLPFIGTKKSPLELVSSSLVYEARLVLQLAHKLQFLLLSQELSQISGSLWDRSLYCQRAERNEWLLLHKFREEKLIPPLKGGNRLPAKKLDDGPAYEGGLVLEPICGFYDNYILYLDFASLYPSIIQQFNLCFTTCTYGNNGKSALNQKGEEQEDKDGNGFPDYQNTPLALLPKLLESLVSRRRHVKKLMKESGSNRELLDIKQKAIKLIANSIYGSLGFQYFRFYAPHIASAVTAWGRHILMMTKQKVERQMECRVVYGDTDSLMVDSGIASHGISSVSYCQALDKARNIVNEVNKNHNKLELEVEGVFKKLLLLKKKKYAALKVVDFETRKFDTDIKGIDIVRRDWCNLTKQLGHKIINLLFSEQINADDIAPNVCDILTKCATELERNKLHLQDFIITKSLTKMPNAYANAQQHPHVVVALEMQSGGAILHQGLEIAYVVCKEGRGKIEGQLSDRCWSPMAVKEKNLTIDLDWYKKTQILPPLARLCQFIESLPTTRLAEALKCGGFDGTEVSREESYVIGEDSSNTQCADIKTILLWMKCTSAGDEEASAESHTSPLVHIECSVCRAIGFTIGQVLGGDVCTKCHHKFTIKEGCDGAKKAALKLIKYHNTYKGRCSNCGMKGAILDEQMECSCGGERKVLRLTRRDVNEGLKNILQYLERTKRDVVEPVLKALGSEPVDDDERENEVRFNTTFYSEKERIEQTIQFVESQKNGKACERIDLASIILGSQLYTSSRSVAYVE